MNLAARAKTPGINGSQTHLSVLRQPLQPKKGNTISHLIRSKDISILLYRPRQLGLTASHRVQPRKYVCLKKQKRGRFCHHELGGIHFWGGLWAKSTPFWMLPFRPATAASSSFFSFSVMSPRMSTALSAPLG
jgi:hypothetical protein